MPAACIHDSGIAGARARLSQGVVLALLFLLPITAMAAARDRAIPSEARQAIRATHEAAVTRDLPALRRLMTETFLSSFGPDAGPDATIRSWEQAPAELDVLARLTAQACAPDESANAVQCPPDAGVEMRAGFVRTPQGWRLAYFLGGD